MSEVFNAYHRWLGIPLQEQPPNHYRLLGLQAFEQDPDVIETAADHREASLRLYVSGKHGTEAKALLKELAEAKVCLLLPERKQAYDARLREQVESQAQSDVGSQLGEYLLEEKLGEGGMGVVYRARHLKLGRTVALKILTKGRVEDPHAIARFEREIAAIGCVNHPNIVHALDAREMSGTRFLVMEYVEGLHLGEILRRCGPLPLADAAHLAYQTAVGLQAAHEHGLVHRDIKPSNLMLTATGMVKVLDLGLARFIAASQSSDEVTASGQAMGTIDYMAPEQVADSRHVDIRADIYSLGCTFYKLLTHQAPFGGSDYAGTLDKLLARLDNDARPIEELREVPPRLAALIARMLARDPDDRFATPADLAAALLPWTSGSDLPGLLARALRIDPAPLPPERRTPEPAPRAGSSSAPPPLPVSELRSAWRVWATTALATAGLLLIVGLVVPHVSRPPPRATSVDVSKIAKPEVARPAGENQGVQAFPAPNVRAATPELKIAEPMAEKSVAEGKPVASSFRLVSPAKPSRPLEAKVATETPTPKRVAPPPPRRVATATKPAAGDGLEAQEQALLRSAAEALSGPQIRALVESSQAVIERALAADHYGTALDIANEVYRVCSTGGGKEFRKAALDRRTRVQQICDRWQQYRAAQALLARSPEDRGANLAVGRWLCFTKGDWAAGLAHLAKSSDAELRRIAERDLRGPAEVSGQLELGDAWWDRALACQGDERRALLLRAADWYRQAEPQAPTGLVKIKIQKRLDEVRHLAPESAAESR